MNLPSAQNPRHRQAKYRIISFVTGDEMQLIYQVKRHNTIL